MNKTKENNAPSFRGIPLLTLVIISYIILASFDQQGALISLQNSAKVLLKILPIFIAIILFTASINYFLRPKQIAKHLGKESGIKGWIWSTVGGVLSHGPVYAWFPLLEDLRHHGMRDGLIVVFIYARAIKLPILPFMIDSFGWLFTLILSIFIILAAIAQGWIMEVLKSKYPD